MTSIFWQAHICRMSDWRSATSPGKTGSCSWRANRSPTPSFGSKGHRYCYRLRPSTYMLAAMLVEEAAQLKATRWATIAPNYEYGQSAVRWFTQLLSRRRPDVEFINSQWPPLGAIDAGVVVNALAQQKPEAILNVTFGPDLARFVRQGNDRGLFEGRHVVSFTTGEPEYLLPLGRTRRRDGS